MLPLKDVNPTRRKPVVTLVLIVACVGVWFLWQQEPQRDRTEDLAFNLEQAAIPCELVEGRPLTRQEVEAAFGRFGGDADACGVGREDSPPAVPGKSVWGAAVASMFFHGGIMHIGGNMLYLWIFGNNIEDHLGHVRYLVFYLVGGVTATGAHVLLQPDSVVPVVGASGAIAAVMGAYLVWYPRAPVRTVALLGFPILITIQARWLLGIWFVLQFLTNPNSGVAWAAHVGGFVFGALFGLLVRSLHGAAGFLFTPDHRGELVGPWDDTGGAGDHHEYRRIHRHR
ncbi:MAG: rhomboid family intramembrane serine protease [Acidimicrobiales bacterium]|nr:rhomboid family intramembrane serine protease [Acidimicrobiales bacterium]